MKLFAFNALAGRFGLLLLAAFFWAQTSVGAEIEVTRSSAEYRESEQFYRISEFFTGRENTGRDVIVRSRADERAGYYVTVKLNRYPYEQQVEEAVRLEIILPGDIEPTLFRFSLAAAKRRSPLILVGLTGEDWPDPSAAPLAWRVSFLDAAGNVIAQQNSFLWTID